MLTCTLDHIQSIAFSPQIVTLTTDHFSIRLARLFGEITLLLLDPGNTTDHRHSHSRIGHGFGCTHTYTAIGWQYTDMQVFDCRAVQMHCNRTYFTHHHH